MSYKITITKLDSEQVTEEGAYTIIDKRPWTDKELADAMASHYGDGKSFVKDNPLKEVRGYAPSRTVTKVKEIEILKQTVDTLDLTAVIMAINGIDP